MLYEGAPSDLMPVKAQFQKLLIAALAQSRLESAGPKARHYPVA